MRVILAVVMLALLTGSASAQDTHVPRYGEADKEKTAQQKAADKAAADAYHRSLGNIPDKGTVDPWGVVRPTDTPRPSETTVKPKKTKTGSTDARQ